MEQGLRILDTYCSPRLDLKQNPLYENTEMGFSIPITTAVSKSISGLTIPLALHV